MSLFTKNASKFLQLTLILCLGFFQGMYSQCAIPSVQAGSSNCPGTVTLTAGGSTGIFRWYEQPSGGSVLATTANYTTPTLYGPKTFYVEAVDHATSPTCSSGRVAVVAQVAQLSSPVASGGGTVTCGGSASLTASGSSGFYKWYNSSGNQVGSGSAFTTPTITDTSTFFVQAIEIANPSQTLTFNFTGGTQTWTVPAGVTSINVDVRGARGGQGYNTQSGYSDGGNGGRVTATIPVTPGQQLVLYVGGAGAHGTNSTGFFAGGWNGGGQGYYRAGGGGGASDIRIGGTALSFRAVVAGGGGAGSYACNTLNHQKGGDGGGLTAGEGLYCNSPNTCYTGTGGGQSSGGLNANCYMGGAVGLGDGFSASSNWTYTAGGGGGYYGGGGGRGGGAGGGSSYTLPAATNVTHTAGFQNTNGQIIISYEIPHCKSAMVPVVVQSTPITPPQVTQLNVPCGNSTPIGFGGGAPLFGLYNSPTDTLPYAIAPGFTFASFQDTTQIYVASLSADPSSFNATFNFTGSPQTWTVPAGVTSIEVLLRAASGGSNSHSLGGLGGEVSATLSVTPGEVLNIYVGGTTTNWQGGWNGGGNSNSSYTGGRGGGGATDIRIGGTALSDRVITAGAGGGAGQDCWSSDNGGFGGGSGTAGTGWDCGNVNANYGGQGATPTQGGNGANWGCGGQNGSLGQGGLGGTCGENGGGGGAGQFGGGGGYFGGGGGGSSFASSIRATNVVHTAGVNTGAGSVTITVPNAGVCMSPIVPATIIASPLTGPGLSDTMVNCGSPVTLFAQSSADEVNWYDAPSGGNLIATGVGLAIPGASHSRTYYVQERNVFVAPPVSLTFTNCGQVGRTGPSQTQCNNTYGPGVVTVNNGIQQWVVPPGIFSLEIEAWGAQGGGSSARPGGLGAYVKTEVAVTPGQVLNIVVGQAGNITPSNSPSGNRGGGGGSFVWDPQSDSEPLIAAGGGGGTNVSTSNPLGTNATITTSGSPRGDGNGTPGTGGNGAIGGAAGYKSDGTSPSTGFVATAIKNGGAGANGHSESSHYGGFGGGGGGGGSPSTTHASGGGGGYSGGSGQQTPAGVGGGGGGSYAAGTNTVMLAGARSGDGEIRISYQEVQTCESPRFPVQVSIDSLPAPTVSADGLGCSPVSHTFSASGGLPNYTWYSTPTGSSGVLGTGSTYSATVNDTTFYYVGYEDPSGCPSKRAQGAIYAIPTPNAGLTPSSLSWCDDGSVVTLQPITPGGVFSGTGIVDAQLGTFDLAIAGPGGSSITYNVNISGCSNSQVSLVDVLPAPNASIVSSAPTLCENASAVTLQVAGSVGTWMGTGVDAVGLVDPALVTPGSYMLYHELVASNGCIDMDSVLLTVNALPDPSISASATTFCNTGSPVSLQSATSGGNWSGPGVNSVTGVFSPTLSGIGNHTVSYAVTQNGCADSSQINLSVIQGPNATIASAPAALCANANTVQLLPQQTGGTWSGPGITNTSTGLFDPNLSGVGVQTIYYSRQEGICSAIDSVQITVNALPLVSISPNAAQTVCEGVVTNFAASGAQSYQWMLNGTPIAGATQPTLAATASGVYSVIGTSASACNGNSSVVGVTMNAKPVINSIQVSPVCQGLPSQFTSSVQVSGSGGAIVASYNWDFAGQGFGSNAQPSFTFNSAGTHPVTLIANTNQGCSDTLTILAAVNPTPVIGTVNATDVCQGNATLYNGTATITPVNNSSIVSTQWQLGNGQTIGGNTPTYLFGQPGVYQYQYVVTTNHGCSATASGSSQVFANPVALFNTSAACSGNGTPFVDLSSSNVNSWSWSFGDGNSSTQANPTHTFATPGQYVVALNVSTADNCTGSYAQSVLVHPSPDANFDEVALGGLTYQFSPDNPAPGASYAWSFGDGTASTQLAPVKTYLFSGTYTVCLTVSQGNCTSQECEQVVITNVMGMDELANGSISLYPNPSSGVSNLSLTLNEPGTLALGIFDLAGKELFSADYQNLSVGSHTLPINYSHLDLASGVYVLKISAGSSSQHLKLIHQSN
jgi:PKD repeat protein